MLALLLAASSALTWFVHANPSLEWQPGAARSQPWRWWTAAFVHWTPLHLGANLLATAMVAAYGWVARVPTAVALAWAAAWPCTQLALLLKPQLLHYAGLSGVLHAGVAAVSMWLVMRGNRTERGVGWMMLLGQGVKLLLEQPWGAAVHAPTELDVPVAPLAHAAGSVFGALFAAIALHLDRRLRLRQSRQRKRP